MKSWKTTLGGVLGAIGAALVAMDDIFLKAAGSVLSAVGVLLLGLAARDNNVSSEDAGAK